MGQCFFQPQRASKRCEKSYEWWCKELGRRLGDGADPGTGWMECKHLFSIEERLRIMVALFDSCMYHRLIAMERHCDEARTELMEMWKMRREFILPLPNEVW